MSNCYLNEMLEMVCPLVESRDAGALGDAIRTGIQDAAIDLSDAKINLIIAVAAEIRDSVINDALIDWRTEDLVGSARQILVETPPAMLLFKYSDLAGNVVATYFEEHGDYVQLNRAVNEWSELKSLVPPPENERRANVERGSARPKSRRARSGKSSR